jgi:hypothetical protein
MRSLNVAKPKNQTGLVYSSTALQGGLHVVLAVRVEINLGATVEGRPLGLILEEAHSLDVL